MQYLYCLALLICSLKQKSKNECLSIRIIKVNFHNEVIGDVSCESFLHEFYLDLDTFIISENYKQQRILNYIQKAIPFENKDGIDARAKAYIYYNEGTIDTLCFGNGKRFHLNNSPALLPNRELIEMLDSLEKPFVER